MDLLSAGANSAEPSKPAPLRAHAAAIIVRRLNDRRPLTRAGLRRIMIDIYGVDDAAGAWTWKDAYDAAEVAEIEYLLTAGKALIASDPESALVALEEFQGLGMTHRLRTEESVGLQQFSTPPSYAYAAFLAADIGRDDLVLEPSAGHGSLAVFAKIAGARLLLNEIDNNRADAMARLFAQCVHRENAAQIDDRLADGSRPSVVLMNPPFSKSVSRGDHGGEAADHVISAFKRLVPGGRLVAIVNHGLCLQAVSSARFWRRLFETGRVRLAAGVDGGAFAARGAAVSTRLLVIDKLDTENASRGGADKGAQCEPGDLRTLIERIRLLPPREHRGDGGEAAARSRRLDRRPARRAGAEKTSLTPILRTTRRQGVAVGYETVSDSRSQQPGGDTSDIYQTYCVQRLIIAGAQDHPTPLTQSSALASVAPPPARYVPELPAPIVADGVLSGPQLESVIYAGEAHEKYLAGEFVRNAETGEVREARPDEAGRFRLRKGYFIGDGTGCGKGRQVAGVIMDNWIKGRRRAVWISKSDKLHEDAVRDWTALGGEASEIIPQSRYRLGKRIAAYEGVIFTTFASLRGGSREGKPSRLEQLVEWLGDDFDGVIAFDEAHAMQNAAAADTDRGRKAASQQGRAGVDLQILAPEARILYASATGASAVENLAYAERLGLWRGPNAPFKSRDEFIAEMNKGGVAAMEMVCRDLKAMGLYCARNLSFEGVEYEFLDHELTPQQIEIYDGYAEAFKVIHNNLEKALEAIEVIDDGTLKNRHAVAAARSSFESMKQRFFNHLLTAMKVPTLIKAIRRDREEGAASIIQIVSTGEAVMDRALADISAQDLRDGNFDLTPRQAVMEYLSHSFPTQLHCIVEKEDGTEFAEPVFDDDGNAVHSQEALCLRDALIERLCSLPPVMAALDQLVWAFGPDVIAEITGRSRRVIRHQEFGGERIEIERRPASINLAETNAFMDDRKGLLIFSEAGGTGRSYHADRSRQNQRRRHHYLLEAGWKADAAVQGLGRSHRTHQASAPLFLPVRSNVKGEKRFLSTVSRRLDALGALTKGERATGGQGLFRSADNLESKQAQEALLIFFRRLAKEPLGGVSLKDFVEMTGLKLLDGDGSLLENLPPIRRFLNRLLALPIAMQNTLFGVFEEIIDNRVEAARAAGTLDVGAETIRADSLSILASHVLRVDPETKAETRLVRIKRRARSNPVTVEQLYEEYGADAHMFYVNEKSGRAAFVQPTTALTDEDTGAVHERFELIRPNDWERMLIDKFAESAWTRASQEDFERVWRREVEATPEFREDEFGLVTGLIMPLWSLLKEKRPTVYRLTADDGATYLGRYISPAMIASLLAACGADGDGAAIGAPIGADDAIAALARGERVPLQSGAFIAMARVMDRGRIEVRDYPPSWLDGLKAAGCFTEIIQWRTRAFAPNDARRTEIVARILARYGAATPAVAAA